MEYTTQAGRINLILGQMLKHAMHVEVLCRSGDMKTMQKNKEDTILHRRWLPYGESTNSPEYNNQYHDVLTIVQRHRCAYRYTDKAARFYGDNIPPMHIVEQCGERMGMLKEKIAYGTLRACPNRFYAGGALGRETVASSIEWCDLCAVDRFLRNNRCKMVNRVISATPNFNTSLVDPRWLVCCHEDVGNDLRNMPGFRPTAQYSRLKPISSGEIGANEWFRFLISPVLTPHKGEGAPRGNTGNLSSNNGRLDVYPVLVIGQDAWADVALRGRSSIEANHIPHTVQSKSDILGQRGVIGASICAAPFIQNDGWMCVLEVAIKDV